MDTLITRMQSPVYKTQYKAVNGSFNRTFFRGLYQGFGPTIITGIPSSAAFFTIYERLKTMSQNAKSAGYFSGVPLPILHGASSAAAELVSCAIISPAEVLKQNAQMHEVYGLESAATRRSPTLLALGHFAKNPGGLWAGYTALAASRLPATSLSFCLYELLRDMFLGETRVEASASRQIAVSALSGALAGGFACTLFVPVDVVKTRMRLAAGNTISSDYEYRKSSNTSQKTGLPNTTLPRTRLGPLEVANGIVRKEGIPGLFRGGGLSFLASALGFGLWLGSYETCILYL
ncbi:hypothetical protein CcaCcLH18_09201 [Colletotrichum camelliae]|nr:hypothetical protein CcaCcLH18_09201 [Colletotrichum camelliae]